MTKLRQIVVNIVKQRSVHQWTVHCPIGDRESMTVSDDDNFRDIADVHLPILDNKHE